MRLQGVIRKLGSRLTRSQSAQILLSRTVHELDFLRGYGSGAYLQSSGETALFKILVANVARPQQIVFDVGANVGDFSAAALEVLGKRVEIHAFEPAKEVCQGLAFRFGDDERVVVNNLALGREPGMQPLYGSSDDCGMASLLDRNLEHVGMVSRFQEMVKVCRLSEYCDSHGVEEIDLLKMDVEGSEFEVLTGGFSLFEKGRIKMCSFEFGGCNLDSRTFLRDYFEFFAQYNMKISRITPAGSLIHLPRYQESFERFTTTNYVALAGAIQ
jgi:FkbM family methyltransferase